MVKRWMMIAAASLCFGGCSDPKTELLRPGQEVVVESQNGGEVTVTVIYAKPIMDPKLFTKKVDHSSDKPGDGDISSVGGKTAKADIPYVPRVLREVENDLANDAQPSIRKLQSGYRVSVLKDDGPESDGARPVEVSVGFGEYGHDRATISRGNLQPVGR